MAKVRHLALHSHNTCLSSSIKCLMFRPKCVRISQTFLDDKCLFVPPTCPFLVHKGLKSKRYSINELSESGFTISITNVTFEDGGIYTCTQYGDHPAEIKVELTVLGKNNVTILFKLPKIWNLQDCYLICIIEWACHVMLWPLLWFLSLRVPQNPNNKSWRKVWHKMHEWGEALSSPDILETGQWPRNSW